MLQLHTKVLMKWFNFECVVTVQANIKDRGKDDFIPQHSIVLDLIKCTNKLEMQYSSK